MSAANIITPLRRSAPAVVQCFKGGELYRGERRGGPSKELVLLFPWLGAKQKYSHKYAGGWTRRGYDVLQVTTSVRDLLFPRSGAEVTALRVVDFLDRSNRDLIIHGLSVGGYLTQRVLIAAKDSVLNITFQVYDSFTNCVGIHEGVEATVPPKYRKIAKAGVTLFTKYADLSSINEAYQYITTSPVPAPTMYIHSLADQVSKFKDIQCVIDAQQKVSPVTTYLIPEREKVPHVTILKYLGEHTYDSLIFNFIEKHKGLQCNGEDYSQSAAVEFLEGYTRPEKMSTESEELKRIHPSTSC